ncbi:ABC transporter permease, partial [Candidatus Woesearchaeota archaeon]
MIPEFFGIAVNSLAKRRMRTFLTMVGVFIGISAVVALISLGQGLQAAISDEFASLGIDKLWIMPAGSAFGASSGAVILDESDRRVIDRTRGVIRTGGWAFQNARIEFKDDEAFGLVLGMTMEDEAFWNELFGEKIAGGRYLTKSDTFKAFVGHNYVEEDTLFPRPVRLYDKLTINNVTFQVIGFLENQGNSGDDNAVHITADAYERVFNKRVEDAYQTIVAQTAPGVPPERVAADVEKNLRNHRGVDEGEEDFDVKTTEQFLDSFNTILRIVNIVIVGIAAISLIVGAIGIMNTMYTAVLEQTKEIGIMKAIGARNRDVLLIFLFESGLLGIVGGLCGTALGLGLAKAVEFYGTSVLGTSLLRAWWNWPLIIAAVLFGFIAGALSGLAPAY